MVAPAEQPRTVRKVSAEDDNELERLASLHRTGLLDSRPEAAYDAIVHLASEIMGSPIALVSLVDHDRQWFKAKLGLDVDETPRDVAFCHHAIRNPFEPLVVEDALADPRFAINPLVLGDPSIRFYAGFPILDDDGLALGTLCVIDRKPRTVSPEQSSRLAALATVAQELIRLRVTAQELDYSRSRAILFERGFDAAGNGLQLVNPDGQILRTNQAFADMLGRSMTDIVGHRWSEFSHPDALEPDQTLELRFESGEISTHSEVAQYVHADGSTIWAMVHVVPVWLGDTRERVNYVQVTDISETVHAQHLADRAIVQLEQSERRLSSLLEPAPDPVLLIAMDGTIEAVNPAATRLLARDGESLIGTNVSMLQLDPDLYEQVGALIRESLSSGEWSELDHLWFEPAVGPPGWYRFRALPVTDGNTTIRSVFINAVNITEAFENEMRLAALTLTDPLTGAANRTALHDRLELALTRVDRGVSAGVAIAVIDVDHFKTINDTHGHDAGDQALIAVVESLRSSVRGHDIVARLGGDEFVVLFDDVDEHQIKQVLAPRLAAQMLRVAVALGDVQTTVTASVGVSHASTRPIGWELIARADAALLHAKRNGRNSVWIDVGTPTAVTSCMDQAPPFDHEPVLTRR